MPSQPQLPWHCLRAWMVAFPTPAMLEPHSPLSLLCPRVVESGHSQTILLWGGGKSRPGGLRSWRGLLSILGSIDWAGLLREAQQCRVTITTQVWSPGLVYFLRARTSLGFPSLSLPSPPFPCLCSPLLFCRSHPAALSPTQYRTEREKLKLKLVGIGLASGRDLLISLRSG